MAVQGAEGKSLRPGGLAAVTKPQSEKIIQEPRRKSKAVIQPIFMTASEGLPTLLEVCRNNQTSNLTS